MHIRRSKEKDRAKVMRMARTNADLIGFPYKKARFEEHIATDKVIVACNEQDRPIGFVYAYMKGKHPNLYTAGRDHLFVSAVCVDKDNQRQGVATAMLTELAASNSHRKIMGSVDLSNEASSALYIAAGFEISNSTVIFSRLAEPKGVTASMLSATHHLRPLEVSADAELDSSCEDIFTGNIADITKYPEEVVLQGALIELEHTNNIDVAILIALDHLKESTDYYNLLEEYVEE